MGLDSGDKARILTPSPHQPGEARPHKESTIPDPRINGAIRVPSIRVIDQDGKQLGVLLTPDALRLAGEAGLDLVEVAPTADPPVCRIMDYGQYHYEQVKREREQRRRSKGAELKEVKLSVKIGAADLATKTRQIAGFLDAGCRVRVSIQFHGREISHSELGRNLLLRVAEELVPHGGSERPPMLEGKSMFMLFAAGAHPPKLATAPAPTPPPASPPNAA
jgi:translation initiation factor IF-3